LYICSCPGKQKWDTDMRFSTSGSYQNLTHRSLINALNFLWTSSNFQSFLNFFKFENYEFTQGLCIYKDCAMCMRPFGKLEVWFGKTCILGPLRERCRGPIRNSVALTAVTPCQSVFPGFEKGFFRPYSKTIRQKRKSSENLKRCFVAIY